MKEIILALIFLLIFIRPGMAQKQVMNSPDDFLQFDFEGNTNSDNYQFNGDGFSFEKGIDGQCLLIQSNGGFNSLKLESLPLDGRTSFSVQFWIKTTTKDPTLLLAQKEFANKGISAQKNTGWA